MATSKRKPANRVYWPNCTVCQYMKKHPDYRMACLKSTYFDPNGRESLRAVNERWGFPVKEPTLYQHMKRHQLKDIERSETLAKMQGKESAVWQRTVGNRGVKKKEDDPKELIENTEKLLEDGKLTTKHEQGLDEFIEMGRAKLKIGDMNISAANYISAIKVKADIEMRNKDRKLDMLKSMFAGAAPSAASQNKKDGEEGDAKYGPQDLNGTGTDTGGFHSG